MLVFDPYTFPHLYISKLDFVCCIIPGVRFLKRARRKNSGSQIRTYASAVQVFIYLKGLFADLSLFTVDRSGKERIDVRITKIDAACFVFYALLFILSDNTMRLQ